MKKALNICRAWYTSSVIVSVISVEETDNVRVSEVLNMSVIYKLIEENVRAILLQKKKTTTKPRLHQLCLWCSE